MIVGQPKVVTFAVSGAPGTRDAFQAAGRAMHDKLDEPAVVDLQLLSVTQRIMCDDPAKVGPLVWNFSATVRSK